jgi:hypothetical protein
LPTIENVLDLGTPAVRVRLEGRAPSGRRVGYQIILDELDLRRLADARKGMEK